VEDLDPSNGADLAKMRRMLDDLTRLNRYLSVRAQEIRTRAQRLEQNESKGLGNTK
jgi:hypothetical protein